MKIFVVIFSLGVLGLGSFGCGSLSKWNDPKIQYPHQLEAVIPLISKKHYKDAIGKIDSYLNASENLKYFGHAYFLKGYILERDGNYDQATGFYRRAIQHSNKYDSLVQAKALYNLSFSLERAGRFDELMTVLADLVNRPQHFRSLTAQVETPARMGAALASLGQIEKARAFHGKAQKNYEKLSRSGAFRPSALAHTKALYYLGVVVYKEKNETFSSLHKKLLLGKNYLLMGAEASLGSWSNKGVSELLLAYGRMWNYISDHNLAEKNLDKTTRLRQKNLEQLRMASDFYDVLLKVRPEEFPLHKVNRNSRKIVEAADLWMEKLENFSLGLDLGPEMLRSKPVKQRPLVRILADEWKRRTTRVNKEQTPNKTIPPPLGFSKKPSLKKEEGHKASDKGNLDDTLKKVFEKEKIKKESESLRKKQFQPLPEKDPNL